MAATGRATSHNYSRASKKSCSSTSIEPREHFYHIADKKTCTSFSPGINRLKVKFESLSQAMQKNGYKNLLSQLLTTRKIKKCQLFWPMKPYSSRKVSPDRSEWELYLCYPSHCSYSTANKLSTKTLSNNLLKQSSQISKKKDEACVFHISHTKVSKVKYNT